MLVEQVDVKATARVCWNTWNLRGQMRVVKLPGLQQLHERIHLRIMDGANNLPPHLTGAVAPATIFAEGPLRARPQQRHIDKADKEPPQLKCQFFVPAETGIERRNQWVGKESVSDWQGSAAEAGEDLGGSQTEGRLPISGGDS